MINDTEAEINHSYPWDSPWPSEGLETLDKCPICDAFERCSLYSGLADNTFFCAPGVWQLWKCGNCRSAYLDPRPTPKTIANAYKKYYTHSSSAGKVDYSKLSILKKIRRSFVNGYTQKKYGCPDQPANSFGFYLANILPFLKRAPDRYFRNLPKPITGANKLLDFGCGDGAFLELAQRCGWDVQGVDPDPAAVFIAREKGLNVDIFRDEFLVDQNEIFDAITLSHVVEHVHCPKRTFNRCFELLKPGGILWLETPNINSFGHKCFGRNWRGLEAPRHLTILSREALHKTLAAAGFDKIQEKSRPSPTPWTYKASSAMVEGLSPYSPINVSIKIRLKAYWASGLGNFLPSRREFLTVIARKSY